MGDSSGNYRSPIINESVLMGHSNVMRTPMGIVRSSLPPPLPPPVNVYSSQQYSNSNYSPYYGVGNGYSSFGGYNGYLGGSGMLGGAYGSGYSGYGGYGSYNRFGGSYMNPNDPENQFIQIAEESSRPAFQSIESLVSAIGNIAAMLDSTFFAITSTFRAILGVTANFGRLRSVFSQFWQTFAIFRGLQWIYKKLLYWMKLSNIDPSTIAFKQAFDAASAAAAGAATPQSLPSKGPSPWPILVFVGFIFSAPYLIMKLIGDLTKSAQNESKDPKTWVNPIQSQAIYDFQPRNASELSLKAGQILLIAPKEVQNTQKLMDTGWALASVDNLTSGLIPISYVQSLSQLRKAQQEQQQMQTQAAQLKPPVQNNFAQQQMPQFPTADLTSFPGVSFNVPRENVEPKIIPQMPDINVLRNPVAEKGRETLATIPEAQEVVVQSAEEPSS